MVENDFFVRVFAGLCLCTGTFFWTARTASQYLLFNGPCSFQSRREVGHWHWPYTVGVVLAFEADPVSDRDFEGLPGEADDLLEHTRLAALFQVSFAG